MTIAINIGQSYIKPVSREIINERVNTLKLPSSSIKEDAIRGPWEALRKVINDDSAFMSVVATTEYQ